MITLSAQWLRSHWDQLASGSSLQIDFSSWDDGDALTHTALGIYRSDKQITGRVVLEKFRDIQSEDDLTVALIQHDSIGTSDTLTAPDGTSYRAVAMDDGGTLRSVRPVRIVDVARAVAERRVGLIESDVLSDARVTIVGLGTGGIHIALELAKAGVGTFSLVDSDRMDVGNVARHQAGLSQVGRLKVLTARDLLLEKNPDVRVATHDFAVGQDQETDAIFLDLVRESELVICATDGRASKLFVNRMCLQVGTSVLFGGAFRRAYGGQVLYVQPGQTPCFQCFVMAMPELEGDEEIASEADAEGVAYSDRPITPEPGLSLDVAPISLMMAKIALDDLLAGRPTTLPSLRQDFAAPWFLWINRPEAETRYSDLPPLSDSSDEMTILRWYGVHLEAEPTCPACGDFEGARSPERSVEDLAFPNVKAGGPRR